jgi:trimethylamine:corrinoid methyltransferase-like protein
MGQLAKEKIKGILKNHRPEPLPTEVDTAIESILEEAKHRN